MDKRALVAEVARRTDFAKWEVNKIVEPLLDVLLQALENGDQVALNNFGRFSLKYHKERETMHPKTKKRVKVPAKASVVFKATRMFKPTDEAMKRFVKQQDDK